MRKIGVIYTVDSVVASFQKRLTQVSKETEWIPVLDEEILSLIREDKNVTLRQVSKIKAHIETLKIQGVEGIISTCSSLGDIMQILQEQVDLPIYRIDEPMFECAVYKGKNITLIATAETTIKPSKNYLKYVAKKMGKNINLITLLQSTQGVVRSKSSPKIIENIKAELALLGRQDVIVLAQASMESIAQPLSDQLGIPVLSSPDLFIEHLKKIL